MGITIDEAINNLKARVKGEFYIPMDVVDDCQDMKMGIEAMKKIKSWRTLFPNPTPTILKGEVDSEGKPLRL